MEISQLDKSECLSDKVFWDLCRNQIFNKEVHKRNLRDFKFLSDFFDIKLFLAFGTLLGAIREKDFIDGDSDVDVSLLESDEDKLCQAINSKIRKLQGFKLIRILPDLITLNRDGGNIDISIFRKSRNYECLGRHKINMELVEHPLIVDFYGQKFLAPNNTESYLAYLYDNWKVPSKQHAMR